MNKILKKDLKQGARLSRVDFLFLFSFFLFCWRGKAVAEMKGWAWRRFVKRHSKKLNYLFECVLHVIEVPYRPKKDAIFRALFLGTQILRPFRCLFLVSLLFLSLLLSLSFLWDALVG